MGFQNIERLLDTAFANGYVIPPGSVIWGETETVKHNKTIDSDGSYFCDASDDPIEVTISPQKFVNGDIINIKKIDNSSNMVIIKAPEKIDGETDVNLPFFGDNLQIQHHSGTWWIL